VFAANAPSLTDYAREAARGVGEGAGNVAAAAATLPASALLRAANINPGSFRNYLSDFGDSLPALFTRGQEIVDTLMKGAQLGFARFLDPEKLPGNILAIVLGRLAGDIGVKLPEKFDLASLGGFLLDLLGLTWDTVLDVAGEVIGPGNLGMLLEFVDTVSAAMEYEGHQAGHPAHPGVHHGPGGPRRPPICGEVY
jgi:hypothetical protein